jgi:DNA-binding NarL/FixJ family response regulator
MQLAQAAGGQGHQRGGDLFVGEEVPAVGDLHHTAGQAEIAGYVGRNGSKEDLIAAVENAVRGEVLCSPRVAASLFRRLAAHVQITKRRPPEAALTGREQDIIALINMGLSNKEIARQLKISLPTVKNHVHNILEKLPVGRRGVAAAPLREAAHVRATTRLSPPPQHLSEGKALELTNR